jgi:hypothetical protein
VSGESHHELDPPDGVHDAEEADEVLRAWIADGQLHVVFGADTFGHDTSEWGRMLGDIGRHIANAVELDREMSFDEALSAIRQGFDVNLGSPVPSMEGKSKGRTEH